MVYNDAENNGKEVKKERQKKAIYLPGKQRLFGVFLGVQEFVLGVQELQEFRSSY